MNDNLKKKLKIVIIIVLILIIIIFGVLYMKNEVKDKGKDKEENNLDETSAISQENENPNSKILSEEYYTIKTCLEMYYGDIKNINGNIYEIPKEDIAKQIIAKLNKEYIESNKLTEEKIINFYTDYKYTNFLIDNLYVKKYNNSITVYLLYGKQIDERSTESEDYGFIVELDRKNNTYSIAPYEFMVKNKLNNINNLNEKDLQIEISNINADELNRNCFASKSLDYKQLIREIFYEYKLYCEYDKQNAYKLLNDEYKEEHFDSKENGENFLQQNAQVILGNYLEKMAKVEFDDNYTQYVCKDNKGNYFIITIENDTINYDIMLDFYTIPTEYFSKEYGNADDKRKAMLNIEKFKQMINLKDYKNAYDVLNEDFKAKYFSTEKKFENYISSNLFESNSFTYTEIANGNKKYKITTRISDEKDNSKENVVKRFTVELLDDDKFSISFDI